MQYTNIFEKIVSASVEQGIYIGTGNPNAKILVIGKELGFDKEEDKELFEKTLQRNPIDWKLNIADPQRKIEICENNGTLDLFNPLYPYYGMEKKEQSAGHTWRKYQLLYEKLSDSKSNNYTFHENFFVTELNQNPSKYSHLQNKNLREISIEQRICSLFKSDFIQSFPIVIVSCGHYPREHGIDICDLFNVDYMPPTRHVNNDSKQWYNLHHNKLTDSPKLVIHTRHLSMNATNSLIENIAKEVTDFCEHNKIII